MASFTASSSALQSTLRTHASSSYTSWLLTRSIATSSTLPSLSARHRISSLTASNRSFSNQSNPRLLAAAVGKPILTPDDFKLPSADAGASAAKRAEVTLRRFWKTVGIMPQTDGSYHITLDGRSLRTPGGTKLSIPKEKRILAMLIANEWENQSEVLKVVGLPMTGLASRVIDGMSNPQTKQGVIDVLLKYLDTDTTCFPADSPSTLTSLQSLHWEPLHEWYSKSMGLNIKSYETLVLGGGQRFEQSEETRRKLREVVERWDDWQVAALERATYSTKSFLIAFALIQGHLTAEKAALASQVEVASQIELWGEVEDTHDVDFQDVRRQLGSIVNMLAVV